MPSPVTAALPPPQSWSEFEDMCADILKKLWNYPYVVRHGRSGQRQQGVDIYGEPPHLGGANKGRYAAAQCKLTHKLTPVIIEDEVEKASQFEPPLSEYIFMTTALRDSSLQRHVRNNDWPFHVHLMFWEDISLELSSHQDLVQKHYPSWMQTVTTKEQVRFKLLSADPTDFDYDDRSGVYLNTKDVKLRIHLDRGGASESEFYEPWVAQFPDANATRQPVYIYYETTKVLDVTCAFVDGGRYIIPLPKSATELTISGFQYHVGRILNSPISGLGFEFALAQAGILVTDDAK